MNNTFWKSAGALLTLLALATTSFAQTTDTRRKVSADLQNIVYGGTIAGLTWGRTRAPAGWRRCW